MKRAMILSCSIIVLLAACKSNKKENTNNNPFLAEYTTPFQVPPFDKIDTSHYIPAFIEGMKQHNAEIDSIVNNTESPTFDNSILKFDKSGKLLTKVSNVFFNLTEAISNDRMQEIAREIQPQLSKHYDEISMNEKLFLRIKTVYDKRNELGLDQQQIRVTEKHYNDFIRKGAGLPKDKQEELKNINSELSTLGLKFGENVLAETNKNFKLVIDKKEDLAGLPEGVIEAAAASAKEKGFEGKWFFTLDKPSLIPFLQYSDKRDLREKLYRAYFMRGDNGDNFDNKEIIAKMAKLRVKKAQLLGYKTWAAYVIAVNMAKTPEDVDEFLTKLWKPAIAIAKKEVIEMQKIADNEGAKIKIQPWDWWYYAEKVRKAKYDLDENQLKPYLSLENVKNGMFYVANKLYDITFVKRTDLPVYHPEVETYEVKESNGNHLGILYLDYFPRESKRGGAWCTSFQEAGWENGKKVDPIVSIVCNFTKPTQSAPSLLTWDETETLFHEFGHALHALFTEGKYNRTAGNVPRDYVELPSQIMENWAGDPEVLRSFAKHYKTGEIMPDKLIEKIQKSSQFNQGFVTGEYLAASFLDLAYHNLTQSIDLNIQKFEKEAMDKIGLIPEILPRYRSTYFSHIWDGGYSAGYYVYLWAEVLDADAFNAFKQSGDIYNKELAAKFRLHCLQQCGDDEGMIQYKKFRGQEPSIDPLLIRRGLK